MALTLVQFRAQYPEFATVNDAVITRYLAEFEILYTGCYGDMYDILQGYYVAHMVSLFYNKKTGSSTGGASVVVMTSRSVGDVSMSGQVVGAATDPSLWDATTYGQMFRNLIGIFGAGPYLTEAAGGYGCP